MTSFDRQINPQQVRVLDEYGEVLYKYTLTYKDYVVNKPHIGQTYHLSWAYSKAMKWKLEGISSDGVTAFLITPKSKKRISSRVLDLRLTSKEAHKVAKGKARLLYKLDLTGY